MLFSMLECEGLSDLAVYLREGKIQSLEVETDEENMTVFRIRARYSLH